MEEMCQSCHDEPVCPAGKAYCTKCWRKRKIGTCEWCGVVYDHLPCHEYYDTLAKKFTIKACNKCIDKTPCCKCFSLEKEGLICDKCNMRGITCFDCAGLKEQPEGKWFCEECSKSRKRNNPFCTQSKPHDLQYWAHCTDCYGNDKSKGSCLSCIASCHQGHNVNENLQYTAFECSCACEKAPSFQVSIMAKALIAQIEIKKAEIAKETEYREGLRFMKTVINDKVTLAHSANQDFDNMYKQINANQSAEFIQLLYGKKKEIEDIKDQLAEHEISKQKYETQLNQVAVLRQENGRLLNDLYDLFK